jgi:hypothetical protein
LIVAAFNHAEFAFYVLFQRLLKLQDPITAQRIFANLSNFERRDLLTDALERTEENRQVRELVLNFIAAYEIAAWNRNFLAHSHTQINSASQDHVSFGKGSKSQPHKWSFIDMTVPDLVRVAQEISALEKFGLAIFAHLDGRDKGGIKLPIGVSVLLPLPDKLPFPTKSTGTPRANP